jgi:LysM repeat protein
MMQDYMVLRKDVKRIETDTNDKVIEEFRKRMDEHKEEATDRHQTAGLLRGMCTAMSVVILAGGIVMFNNYERMQNMESVIVSAIPAKAEKFLAGDRIKESKSQTGVVVEDAEAGISPTTAVNKETMSNIQPTQAGETQAPTEAAVNPETSVAQTEAETTKESQAIAESEKTTEQTSQAAAETTKAQTGESKAQKETSQAPSKSQEAAASGAKVHIVQEGETLYGISLAEYHTVNKLKEICELNGLEDENKIVAGQKLLLP